VCLLLASWPAGERAAAPEAEEGEPCAARPHRSPPSGREGFGAAAPRPRGRLPNRLGRPCIWPNPSPQADRLARGRASAAAVHRGTGWAPHAQRNEGAPRGRSRGNGTAGCRHAARSHGRSRRTACTGPGSGAVPAHRRRPPGTPRQPAARAAAAATSRRRTAAADGGPRERWRGLVWGVAEAGGTTGGGGSGLPPSPRRGPPGSGCPRGGKGKGGWMVHAWRALRGAPRASAPQIAHSAAPGARPRGHPRSGRRAKLLRWTPATSPRPRRVCQGALGHAEPGAGGVRGRRGAARPPQQARPLRARPRRRCRRWPRAAPPGRPAR
jgi:hypothetical protein